MCTVRGYSSSADTVTVELQGLGIIDSWIDGVKVAQTVNRGLLFYGAPGVLSMPDLHRICEASLIQVLPPSAGTGSVVQQNANPVKTQTGYSLITTGAGGSGSTTVTFSPAFATTPTVSALADLLYTVTVSGVSTTGATLAVSGGPINGYVFVAWSATG